MRWAGQADVERPSRSQAPYEFFGAHSGSLVAADRHAGAPDLGVRGLACFVLGMVVGAVVAAVELRPEFNYHTWAYWSFASGSLGIWVIAGVVIANLASSPKAAAVGTFTFLTAVVLTYFMVRYANFTMATTQLIASMSERMNTQYSNLHNMEFWTPAKTGSFVVCLVGAALGALDAWGLRKFAGRSPLYWTFAAAPLCLVVFEGWSYFVPMAAYVSIGFVPAVVDVAGSLLIAWLVVRLRSDALLARALGFR